MQNSYNPDAMVGKVLGPDDLSQMPDVFLMNPGNARYMNGLPNSVKQRRSLVPLLLLILGLMFACFAGVMASSAPQGQAPIFYGIAIGIVVLCIVLIALSVRSSGRQARFDKDAKLLQATLTTVSSHERAPVVKVLNNTIAVIFFIIEVIESFTASSGYQRRNAERRASGGPDMDKYFGVDVTYQFTTPNGIQLTNKMTENRPDLKGQMLPSEGSRALVLYLNDQEYKLL